MSLVRSELTVPALMQQLAGDGPWVRGAGVRRPEWCLHGEKGSCPSPMAPGSAWGAGRGHGRLGDGDSDKQPVLSHPLPQWRWREPLNLCSPPRPCGEGLGHPTPSPTLSAGSGTRQRKEAAEEPRPRSPQSGRQSSRCHALSAPGALRPPPVCAVRALLLRHLQKNTLRTSGSGSLGGGASHRDKVPNLSSAPLTRSHA